MTTTNTSELLYTEIAQMDKTVFDAYNTCNLKVFETFFAEDLEFYHDKSGLISSRKTMLEALDAMLCGNSSVRTRRELIQESLRVYPLENFGAIQIGEHYYYQSRSGQPEKLVEVAKFTHIWEKKDTSWRITRVMSYDHQSI